MLYFLLLGHKLFASFVMLNLQIFYPAWRLFRVMRFVCYYFFFVKINIHQNVLYATSMC